VTPGYEPNGYGQGGYGARDHGQAGYPRNGYQQNGYQQDGYPQDAYDGGGYGGGANGRAGYGRVGYGAAGFAGANGGTGYGPGGYGGPGHEGAGYEGPGYEPRNGAGYQGPPDGGTGYGRAAQPDAPAPAMSPGQAPATVQGGRPYGRISIFTLLDDKAAEFDLLAEQTAEAVRVAEPDTLVYVIHLVPKAPMQRIFYEIYRDREAFDLHERQTHNQRFAAERRPYVLATNIIELRLKYAKVAPLSPSTPQKSQTQRYSQMPQAPQGQLPSPESASRPSAPNRAQPSPMGQRYGG
jgi:quinol monooxygenase YgiN